MRVKWEQRSAREFVAHVGDDTILAWAIVGFTTWTAELVSGSTGELHAQHDSLPSERAAKREAVRMWRALRGKK